MKMPGSYRRKHDRVYPRGWFSLFLRLGGWVGLLAGAGLLLATYFSAVSLRLADRLDAEAGYATAVVVGKGVTGDVGDPDAYLLTLGYKTPSGGVTAEQSVTQATYERVEIGAELPVRYLRDDPRVIELEPGQTRNAGFALRILALVLGLIGLGALWRFGNQANAAILARRDGEQRLAVVTDVVDAKVEINDVAQGRLLWREPDGQTGRSLMRGMHDLTARYSRGDKIVVFRRGKDAFWEGDVGPPKREIED